MFTNKPLNFHINCRWSTGKVLAIWPISNGMTLMCVAVYILLHHYAQMVDFFQNLFTLAGIPGIWVYWEKNHENSPIGFIKFVKVMPVLPSASAFVLSYSVTIGYGSNYSSMVTCHGMTWLF